MQGDGACQRHPSSRWLPFHLSSLDFDVTPSGVSSLTSEQLALVHFHPDANDAVKLKAEILFFKRREQDSHLLVADHANHEDENELLETKQQLDGSLQSSATAVNGEKAAKPNTQSATIIEEAPHVQSDTEIPVESVVLTGVASRPTPEEGELSEDTKTPTPDLLDSANAAVKHEDLDDDLIILGSHPPNASTTRTSRSSSSGRVTSAKAISVNVGNTYSARKSSASIPASIGEEVEHLAPKPKARHRRRDEPAGKRKQGSDEHNRRSRRDRPRREKESASGFGTSSRESSSKHKRLERDRAASSRSLSSKRSSRRRRRSRSSSYGSSSGSASDSGSSYYSSDYSSSSYSTASGSGSRSRSSTPDRRRRHRSKRRRHDHARPMPAAMSVYPAPHTLLSPEDMSRQQLSHMYRNMPSNADELMIRGTTPTHTSPPRPVQNTYHFPGQVPMPNGQPPSQAGPSRPNGTGQHPVHPQRQSYHQPGNGYGGGGPSLPPLPSYAKGWPDPPDRPKRNGSSWPGEGRDNSRSSSIQYPPRRASVSKPVDAWGAPPNTKQQDRTSDGWGSTTTKSTSNGWGDEPAVLSASTSASRNDAWGSPEPTAGKTQTKASASAWGSPDPVSGAVKDDWGASNDNAEGDGWGVSETSSNDGRGRGRGTSRGRGGFDSGWRGRGRGRGGNAVQEPSGW